MSGHRFTQVRGGRQVHLAWEMQPLVRSTARQRVTPFGLVVAAFLIGLTLGLIA